MKCGTIYTDILEGRLQCSAFFNRARFDTLVDADEFLIDHSTRTNVLMANLGVPHDALRQSDFQSTGCNFGARILSAQSICDRCIGQLDGIVSIVGRIMIGSPTITNNENDWLLFFRHK